MNHTTSRLVMRNRRSIALVLMFALMSVVVFFSPSAKAADKPPVLIGFDGEFGHSSSTSAEAIKQGILIATSEINQNGGVLGGRPLQLWSGRIIWCQHAASRI